MSGLFAASAALFGKLGTTPTIIRSTLSVISSNDNIEYITWIGQIVAIGLMIASNGIMWSQYSLALAYSDVTLHVTTINTVSNFIFTALFGWIIFAETISLVWSIGISCILVGIVLLKEPSESVLHDNDESNVKLKKFK
ncbi:hypothetical protein RDWZM_006948 [Blomia tropicalis]|uniref:EamA domain-containing protein n=1 Tax=Blomia tropicalis TaxID=40697 RepID=A0A9Q0RNW2_BLOTA|nr:hypothetical protein RDWZM_006948 [Blomia tropicalis]